MLNTLHIESFKCFERLDLPMRPLTLLSGVNSGGKSTVIQAIVLLSQTLNRREGGNSLILAGPDLALGNAADVLNHLSARRKFALGASTNEQCLKWTFVAEDRHALSVELDGIEADGKSIKVPDQLRWLLPIEMADASSIAQTLRRASWITAERTGPRELLPLPDPHGRLQVGPRGEYAAGLLHWRGQDSVRESLRLANVPPTLFHQVRARVQSFFPGCDIQVEPIPKTNKVSLQFRTNERFEFQRPQNVGFGVTQLFPIIVATLAAEENSLVIVENPEVHLHPKAQQEIGLLLGTVAASGVQVLLETHSDHVLNGVRLAVKRNILQPEDAAFHFFDPNDVDFTPQSPSINTDGRLDCWPNGFFDQFDHALSELL